MIEIIGTPRSGTTMLGRTICKTRPAQEPFNQYMWKYYDSSLLTMSRRDAYAMQIESLRKKNSVVVNHAVQLKFLEKFFPKLFDDWVQIPKYKIVLYRPNLIDTVISLAYSRVSNAWHYSNHNDFKRCVLDLKTVESCALDLINELNWITTNMYARTADKVVTYDDIVTAKPDDICRLLGFNHDSNTEIGLIGSPPKVQAIDNLQSVTTYLHSYLKEHKNKCEFTLTPDLIVKI